jgi:hypothetical protein
MSYILRGRLCGFICAQCPEALSDVTVRLYRSGDDRKVTALAVASRLDDLWPRHPVRDRQIDRRRAGASFRCRLAAGR